MFISSLKRDYFLFQTLNELGDVKSFVAKDPNTKSLFLINQIANRSLINTHIKELMSLEEERILEEFADLFTFDSNLYLAFKFTRPNPLVEYLHNNELSFAEKIELLKSYFFEMSALNNLPLVLKIALTDPDNINVHSDGHVYFNFLLKAEHFKTPMETSSFYSGIAQIIQTVFEKELTAKKGQKLQIIIEKCYKNLYHTLPEIIKDIEEVDTSSYLTRIIKRIKARYPKALEVFKKVSFAALAFLALFFIYTKYIGPATQQTLNSQFYVIIGQYFRFYFLSLGANAYTGYREKKTVSDVLIHRDIFDTQYAAMYHPWLVTYDFIAKKNTSIPPSGTIAGIKIPFWSHQISSIQSSANGRLKSTTSTIMKKAITKMVPISIIISSKPSFR